MLSVSWPVQRTSLSQVCFASTLSRQARTLDCFKDIPLDRRNATCLPRVSRQSFRTRWIYIMLSRESTAGRASGSKFTGSMRMVASSSLATVVASCPPVLAHTMYAVQHGSHVGRHGSSLQVRHALAASLCILSCVHDQISAANHNPDRLFEDSRTLQMLLLLTHDCLPL